MNERFLFRGKVDSGEWFIGGMLWYGKYQKPQIWVMDELHGSMNFQVDPKTVGQCTGIRDEKDNLIFEGDFLYDGDGETCLVKWHCGAWAMWDLDCNSQFANLGDERFVGVVCGNIHDNPELLRADANE